MWPQNLDAVDRHILEQDGTDTVREIIMHDDWPDFTYEMRCDGLTAVRFPHDEELYHLVNPDELAALLLLKAGAQPEDAVH